MEKLKPCLCGGEVGILNTNERTGNDDSSNYPVGTIIGCFSCGEKTKWYDGFFEKDGTGETKAIEAWNRREGRMKV